MFCLIPMDILRSDYNLELGQIVIAVVEAKNIIGFSL
jgi:hypothetical protein